MSAALERLDPFSASWFRRTKVSAQLQSESAECGLACLAMIATFYGYKTSVAELRDRFGSSGRGVTFADLISQAGELRLSSRPVRVALTSLNRLRLPAIIHWDLDHFVVLEDVRSTGVTITDPAIGRRTMPMEECSRHFTGVALELQPSPGFSKKAAPKSVRLGDFLKGTRGLGKSLALVLVVSLTLQAVSLTTPLLTQVVLDQALAAGDMSLVMVLAMSFAAVGLLQAGLGFARSLAIFHLGATLKFVWGARLFHHLIRLPLSYFERRQVGDVVSRFNSLGTIQSLLTNTVIEAILDGLLAVTTLAVMLAYSPKLTIVSVVALAAILILRMVVLPAQRSVTHTAILHAAKEDSHLLETLRGMLTIKSFGLESMREATWQGHAANEIRLGVASNLLPMTEKTIGGLVMAAENIVVIAWGASLVMSGDLTVGMLVAFIAYKSQFTGRASGLIDRLIEAKLASVHAERLADIVNEAEELEEVEPGQAIRFPVHGRIEAKDLAFRYGPSEAPVFENLNVSVEPGECLVIVGPSGVGKTTLLKVLMGLLKPASGRVIADGVELKPTALKCFREQVAAVMQEDTLLNGSILDNITLFDPTPNRELVHQVVGLAALTEVIGAMPMGYSTPVGDMGSSLSGGQRQRLLLARALYRKPKILFLDEATAHLDVLTEAKVHDALSKMGMTRVVISHRPGTTSLATKVLQLGKSVAAPEARVDSGREPVAA